MTVKDYLYLCSLGVVVMQMKSFIAKRVNSHFGQFEIFKIEAAEI